MEYTPQQRRAHIRAAQSMLDRLLGQEPDWPGVFDAHMTARVRQAQQRLGLPVTGEIDHATWYGLYRKTCAPSAARPLPVPLTEPLRAGDRSSRTLVLQSVLHALPDRFADLTRPALSGVYDDATVQAVTRIQRAAGLPSTGETDCATWNHIVGLYALSCRRAP